jgi:uncharacterized membrane protein YhaH (DUF805 family)
MFSNARMIAYLRYLIINMNITQAPNCIGFWQTFEFFRLEPRLGRIKFLGLISFWASIIYLLGLLIKERLSSLFGLIVFIIILPNLLALVIRRLHDINLSAWWILIVAVPLVGAFVNAYIFWFCATILPIFTNVILYLVPGTKNVNKFGAQVNFTEKRYYFLILSIPIVNGIYFLMNKII